MGYCVLHLEKAKGADSGMSAHIERTIVPKNIDPTRTHLNRELIMFPDGVCNRTLAIRHRLDTAGLKRKIGKNQVQAIRIVLSGTHEDMARMEDEGRLGEWCDDSVAWLRETYGAENLVSAVLHMDEETPHIHATVVPIVQGERRKQKKEENARRRYRTKAPAPRLCADEVMSRASLIRYQDTYAEHMEKYGLKRGVRGSLAKHLSTHEYYRSLITQGEDIQANIATLLSRETEASRIIAEAEQAKQELARIKAETKTVELKNSAARTATAALNGIGSLLGSNKMSRLESENRQLHGEVAELKESIEQMRTDMQKMRDSYTAEQLRVSEQHQREIGNFRRIIDKAKEWFPILAEFLRIERICRSVGLSERHTDELLQGKVLVVTGKLFSDEYKRSFTVEKVRLKVGREERDGKTVLDLLVDRVPIAAWFKEKWEKVSINRFRRNEMTIQKERGVRL
ncbi:mobilization protein [Porphyromonas gingivalis W83]|uniref:Mobilization protein n=1 Tax=Porphyromonas gingivalis (strain ATCC BAA-308 / W83) TaxID=242619 RepID=Q7MVF5_PORGI|nr:MobV family relaxase [Porphyromonas gingivalis]AAQ66220.1 mobilization protein [Porphyromonas gingivalis W83]AUR45883.1 mobilization protein [Porphyromonas gingivalis]USI94580.1 plasmid recombination protein [Porphyromonas gingivalis]USI95030.1 plasmid recombination protein [Porphyromonas gingivalis]USI96935.1 plasmid recombination protein [Porphyromonas gingivalis]